jgi:hypothetical protein
MHEPLITRIRNAARRPLKAVGDAHHTGARSLRPLPCAVGKFRADKRVPIVVYSSSIGRDYDTLAQPIAAADSGIPPGRLLHAAGPERLRSALVAN